MYIITKLTKYRFTLCACSYKYINYNNVISICPMNNVKMMIRYKKLGNIRKYFIKLFWI